MVIGPPLFISLGFFLSVIAVESLVLLASARVSAAIIVPSRVRSFKRERASATLKLGSVRPKLVGSRRFLVLTPYGLECATGEFREGSGDLTLVATRAGRFENLSLKMIDEDILGLFVRETVLPLQGFVLESLPISLRAPARPVLVSPISLGDIPAGRRGGGQELHAVEQYYPGLDAKDVIWKRVARSPTEELVSRTRESSIRRSVTIGIALAWKSEESRTILLDITAEAVAQIGKTLLELGIAVRISFVSHGRTSSVESSTLIELVGAILGISSADNSGPGAPGAQESISTSDIILAEIKNYVENKGLSGTRSGTVLLVSETPSTPFSRDKLFVFTGREDLTALIESVIET
jgi:uncharacterized protein (DUF58 family)